MVRRIRKWTLALFLSIIIINVFVESLPISRKILTPGLDVTFPVTTAEAANFKTDLDEDNSTEIIETENTAEEIKYVTRNVRPGQEVRNYAVEISLNGKSFSGRAVMSVRLDIDSRGDPIAFHLENLEVQKVLTGVFTDVNAVETEFSVKDSILKISPSQVASTYVVIIEYTGQLSNNLFGLYEGHYDDNTYLAMNLHPANARRVFPCVDEPSEATTISFTFNNVQYDHMVMNSMLEDNSQTQFKALQGPPHLWGMVAHNLNNIYYPTQNVLLNARPGVFNQEAQASIAINHYFHALNDWTNKPYLEIILNQDGRMNVVALPDSDRDWYALSTVCIWEPYILMELTHSVKQRHVGLVKLAEAMARQWFGYVIHPENWRHQWVITGLGTYAAYDVFKDFQDGSDTDNTLLDVNTLFVTEVVQESLLRDAYVNSQPLEPAKNIFNKEDIRDNINGLLKYKAPAVLRMLRLILGGADDDFIKKAARALLNSRALQTVNSLNFYDAINSEWLFGGSNLIQDIPDYLEPWVQTTGYPTVHVGLRQGGVLLTQERFSFSPVDQINYLVPITYTTSVNPKFESDNIYPVMMMDATTTLNMALDDGDWVLFNIQGQGYYRVNYDADLWERIIEALEDPDRREVIHPLNRATLVDDALNLARASKLDYEIALRIVFSMEHETEYAVWKAFARNMNFIRKRLVALVEEDGDLDQEVYTRLVSKIIGTFENEIGFTPDNVIEPAMVTLVRGLVMDHACRANYDPCIAAAVDWFYDPNDNSVVNPNIPRDIRPAVYCTMVREGDGDVISALYDRLEIEPSLYERLVILESLACSQDDSFIKTLLEETIALNGPYTAEEGLRIFKAVAESSYQNARLALNFIILRTNEIRRRYGGPEKLEEVIYTLVDNIANANLATDFSNWVESRNNNLGDSENVAEKAALQVKENLNWDSAHIDYVYDWIVENDAPTLFVSAFLLTLSLIVAVLNH
ncbi:unnamed protein product [Parnassius mnemosyne]|uniref:Aminopeptidase n=1 Tax=Parnassius mnemosyne TaxID=213953 RepID=A0AAV1LYA9_9NEOP